MGYHEQMVQWNWINLPILAWTSLGDDSWNRPTACLNFGNFNETKRISSFRDLRAHKTFTTRWSVAEFKFESNCPSSSPCCPGWHLAITSEVYSSRQSKVLTAKSMAEILMVSAKLVTFLFSDFVSGDLALTGFKLSTWTSDFHCFGALGDKLESGTGPGLGHTCGPGWWAWL